MRSNESIRANVVAELARTPGLAGDRIEVSVASGDVTLRGAVDEFALTLLADQAVRRVAGVRRVKNELAGGDWADERGPLETPFEDASVARAAMSPRFKITDGM